MEIYTLKIYNQTNLEYSYYNFKKFSFFFRDGIKETVNSIIDKISKRIESLDKNILHIFQLEEIKGTILYIYIEHSVTYYLIANDQLLKTTLFNILSDIKKLHRDQIDALIDNFNDNPDHYKTKVDQIKCQLNETTQILFNSIDKLLERGETLDDLVTRTNDLNDQSIIFARSAKMLNCPCIII